MANQTMSHRLFVERLIIAIIVIGLALLLWNLRGLFMLIFGAVITAVIFNLLARPIHERLGLHRGVSLFVAVMLVAGVLVGAFWLFGAEVGRQANALNETIPAAWAALQTRLDAWGVGEAVRASLGQASSGGGVMSNLGGIAMSVGAGVADTLLVIVGGIYLAAQPGLYRRGIVKLVPPTARPLADQALDDSGRALRLWLLGQLASMTIVGLITGIGLWFLGVPSALTLGLLAGLLEFVPYVGPLISALPALLLALAIGPETALWTGGLYLAVQQLEGNAIQPLVQQRAVDLPPALLLFSLVAGGLIFGVIGILFAAPLTVVLFVMVKRLYVREALHTATPTPGEESKPGKKA